MLLIYRFHLLPYFSFSSIDFKFIDLQVLLLVKRVATAAVQMKGWANIDPSSTILQEDGGETEGYKRGSEI